MAFIDTPVDDVPLHEIGPMVEHHPMFPKRVNFEIVNLIDSGRVKARVWERGSGLTEACGHRRVRYRRGGAVERP